MRKETTINKQSREISEFHDHFRPFVNQIYRGALILTGDARSAEKLRTEIYLKAFMQYLQMNRFSDFKSWLLQIVDDCFATRKPADDIFLMHPMAHAEALNLVAAVH